MRATKQRMRMSTFTNATLLLLLDFWAKKRRAVVVSSLFHVCTAAIAVPRVRSVHRFFSRSSSQTGSLGRFVVFLSSRVCDEEMPGVWLVMYNGITRLDVQ